MHKILFASTLILLIGLSGCSDPQVHGSIKYEDGSPVSKGILILQGSQSQGIGELKPDGTFQIYQFKPGDGLKPGRYDGYITGAVSIDDKGKTTVLVPEKYTGLDRAGIVYDTKVNKGRLDIVVEKP